MRVRSLGPVPIRGWRARGGVRAARRRAERGRGCRSSAARGLTRFIGRERRAGPASSGARAGPRRPRAGRRARRRARRRQVAPGAGSSRTRTAPTDWLVLESSAVSYGKAAPLLPVDRADEGLLRRRGSGRHAPRAREAHRQAPHARRGAPARARRPSRRSSTCRSTTRRGRALGAERSAGAHRSTPSGASCCARASAQPLLLVFEDLHWIDADTQALLDEPDREPAVASRCCLLRQLPARVPARLGRQDLLRPDPSRSAGGRPPPRRSLEALARDDDPTLAPLEVAPDRARRRATRSSSRRACARWRRRASWPASAAPTVW